MHVCPPLALHIQGWGFVHRPPPTPPAPLTLPAILTTHLPPPPPQVNSILEEAKGRVQDVIEKFQTGALDPQPGRTMMEAFEAKCGPAPALSLSCAPPCLCLAVCLRGRACAHTQDASHTQPNTFPRPHPRPPASTAS